MDNPLLTYKDLPPFEDIRDEHVTSAVREMLLSAGKQLDSIEEKSQSLEWVQFQNAIDDLDESMSKVWGVVGHLTGVRVTDTLRKAHEEVLGEVVDFSLRYGQSEKIFKYYKNLKDSPKFEHMSGAVKRAVNLAIQSAESSGVSLSGAARESFNKLSKRLSELSTKFTNNVLDSTKKFYLVVEDKNQLKGLPDSWLELASQKYNEDSKHVGKKSTPEKGPWQVSLDLPSYMPVMQHAENRNLRKQVYIAYLTRASEGEFDNSEIMVEILSAKQEKAKLLGYQSYADFSVSKKMAKDPSKVYQLIDSLREASFNFALKELDDVKVYAKSKGCKDELDHWDLSYWSERLREDRYGFNEEELRPYFPLERVLSGMFSLVKTIFDIDVKQSAKKVQLWHPDVRYFNIFQSGKEIASFYLDPYSRPDNKRGGAWMDNCRDRRMVAGVKKTPIAYLVCNAMPPVGEKPSLMSFGEVETLFHEFGHGLQHMLTNVDLVSVAGINGVEWDAVELASQFMENWCYHKPTLDGLSQHYKNGTPLPVELFEKVVAAKNYQAAMQMLRQLRFAKLDMKLHHQFRAKSAAEIFALSAEIAKDMTVMPPSAHDRFVCSFSHIFAGGYSAGYYSYKWAEVLSADAFSAFEEAPLSDLEAVKRVGARYRNTVLALGGSVDPSDVFESFRGRAPSIEPLLKHCGLRNS